jgi:hypothetical protein
MALIAAVLLVVAALACFVAYRLIPHNERLTYKDTPNVVWMKQKALECKGDINKLSPEDRQKLQQVAGAYANMMMPRYYEMQGGKIDKTANRGGVAAPGTQ